MKTLTNKFSFLKSGNKQNLMACFIAMIILLLNNEKLMAQGTTNAASINDLLIYWFLGVSGLILIIAIVYVMSNAISVLSENGRTLEFNFPIIRKMANNEKTVAIIIAFIILAGIIYTVKFWG